MISRNFEGKTDDFFRDNVVQGDYREWEEEINDGILGKINKEVSGEIEVSKGKDQLERQEK